MAVRAAGWVVRKVCDAQESVSQASRSLTEARIDMTRLSDKVDGEDFTTTDLYREMDRLNTDLIRIENELDRTIRRVAGAIPESAEGDIQ